MAEGLNLGVIGGVRATAGPGFFNSGATSATEAAFGGGYTQPGTPSSSQALVPNDSFGMAFWGGVVSLALLLFIRHSLPH